MLLRPLDGLEVDALLNHLPQRAHVPQTLHVLLAQVNSEIYLLLRREAAQPKPDGRVRQVLAHADGAQHCNVRWRNQSA